MAIAVLVWLVLLYLFSSKPGWFACLLVLLVVGISSQDADEREPRQQIAGGARCVHGMNSYATSSRQDRSPPWVGKPTFVPAARKWPKD